MFFASWRNVSKSHGPHGQTSSRQNVILRYPRSIWTVSTAISLLSARHLLLVINFHFPWMLYCTQLGVATSFVTLSFFLDRTSGRTHDDGERFLTSILPRLRCGTLVMGVSMIFTALSTLCLLQATLWFYNLPTIVMLGVSSRMTFPNEIVPG